jgi:hypothetical protein
VKWPAVTGLVLIVALAVGAARREESRGTFDALEGRFLSWLAANSRAVEPLPPLVVVLYDEEASQLSGQGRLGALDGALFARAASRLGAVAAGMEGLEEDPRRLIEAAGGMALFAGYGNDRPPGLGWTPLRGQPPSGWPEVAGLAGRPGMFARGFLPAPSAAAGPREVQLAARSADRAVPSFLVLAWGAAHGWKARDLTVDAAGIAGPRGRLRADAQGRAWFLPGPPPEAVSMNELLIAAETFERLGGRSRFEGRLLVLVRATPDVTRVVAPGEAPLTPGESWARSWEAVRHDRLFQRPGWWFPPALVAAGVLLALSSARRSNGRMLLAGFLAVLIYLLAALGAWAGSGIFLPAGPALCALLVSLAAGRLACAAGWLPR